MYVNKDNTKSMLRTNLCRPFKQKQSSSALHNPTRRKSRRNMRPMQLAIFKRIEITFKSSWKAKPPEVVMTGTSLSTGWSRNSLPRRKLRRTNSSSYATGTGGGSPETKKFKKGGLNDFATNFKRWSPRCLPAKGRAGLRSTCSGVKAYRKAPHCVWS